LIDKVFVHGEDGFQGGLADVATDVRLEMEQHVVEGKDFSLFQVLEDGINLKDVAFHV
jgi:hypothetical protein